MKKVSLSTMLLLAGGVLTLAFSCTCQKKQDEMPKGPDQEPFEKCECTDCECEEGASSQGTLEQIPAKLESEQASTQIEEQTSFVTPTVVEAVKIEVQEAAVFIESAPEVAVEDLAVVPVVESLVAELDLGKTLQEAAESVQVQE